MPDINADVRFVTERRNRNIGQHIAIGVDLTLADLHRPTRIYIFLSGLRWLIRPDLIR